MPDVSAETSFTLRAPGVSRVGQPVRTRTWHSPRDQRRDTALSWRARAYFARSRHRHGAGAFLQKHTGFCSGHLVDRRGKLAHVESKLTNVPGRTPQSSGSVVFYRGCGGGFSTSTYHHPIVSSWSWLRNLRNDATYGGRPVAFDELEDVLERELQKNVELDAS